MYKAVLLAVFAVSFAVPSGAQTAPASHTLPFTSEGNALELALDSPTASAPGTLAVAVASSPAWLAFSARRVLAEIDTDEAFARLTFSVHSSAPVSEVSEIILHVLDETGAIRAEKRIPVEVAPPADLALGLPHPNPARHTVTLPYVLPSTAQVTVDVLDVLGRRVRTLAAEERPAGAHEATVDTSTLAAGAYVIRLVAEDAEGQRQQQIQRLTVAR